MEDPFDIFGTSPSGDEWARVGIFLVNRKTGKRKPAPPPAGALATADLPPDPYADKSAPRIVAEQLYRRGLEATRSLADLPLAADRLLSGLKDELAGGAPPPKPPIVERGRLVPAPPPASFASRVLAAATEKPPTAAEIGMDRLRKPYLQAKDDLSAHMAARTASPLATALTDTGLEGAALLADPTLLLAGKGAKVAGKAAREALETAGERAVREASGQAVYGGGRGLQTLADDSLRLADDASLKLAGREAGVVDAMAHAGSDVSPEALNRVALRERYVRVTPGGEVLPLLNDVSAVDLRLNPGEVKAVIGKGGAIRVEQGTANAAQQRALSTLADQPLRPRLAGEAPPAVFEIPEETVDPETAKLLGMREPPPPVASPAEAGFLDVTPLDDARKSLKRYLTFGGKFKVAAEDFADPAQRKFVREIPKRIEGQGGKYSAIMHDKRAMDEELFQAVKAETGYGKSPKELFAQIQEVRAGAQPIDSLPPRVREVAAKQFEFLDALQTRFATSGAVPEDVGRQLMANSNWYHRAYRKYDTKGWAEKARALPDWGKAEATVATEIRRRAEKDGIELTEDELRLRVEGVMNSLVDADTGPEALSAVGGTPIRSNDILRERSSIPPEIRAVMGEYKDWRHTFEKSVHNLAWDLTTHDMLDSLGKEGLEAGVFRRVADGPAGNLYRGISSGNPVGDIGSRFELQDMLTSPGLAKAIGKEFQVAQNHWWNKLAATVSLGKTLGNFPTGYVRNILAHGITTAANGNVPFNPARSRQWLEAWRSPSMRRRMVELGITNQGATTREVEDWFRILQDGAEGPVAAATSRVGKLLRKGWEFGDDAARTYNWLAETDDLIWAKGLSRPEAEELAADRVKDTFQTYSRAPEIAKTLRRTPLGGPGTTFYVESVRNIGNIVRIAKQDIQEGLATGNKRMVALGMKRVAGLAVTAAASASLATASRLSTGMDKESAAFDADQEEAFRKLVAPDYHRNAEVLVTEYKPGKSLSYWDVSFLNPYTGMVKPAIAMNRSLSEGAPWHEAVGEFLDQAAGGDVLAKGLLELGLNRRLLSTWPPEIGGKLSIDGRGEPDWLYQAHRRLSPGSAISAEAIARGAGALPKTTDSGRTYNLGQELVSTVSGFKRTTIEIGPSFRRRVGESLELARDARSKVRSLTRSRPPTPEMAEVYLDRLGRSYEGLREAVQGFQKLGMDDEQIYEEARATGAGKALVEAALANDPVPPPPSFEPHSEAEADFLPLLVDAYQRRYSPAPSATGDPFDIFIK